MQTKVVEPKTFFYAEGKTSLRHIHEYSNEVIPALMKESERAGVQITGPMEFIYFGACADMDKEFTLQIALPVKEEKEVSKEYGFKQSVPFKCISHEYKGDVSKMGTAYENLFQQLFSHQLQPNDEVREVYAKWEHLTSANNITEIQIGVN